MEPDTVLTTAIEVGIGIAGFSGIVAAIGPRRRTEWSALTRILLSILLVSTGALVGFCFLPLLLMAGGMGAPGLWMTASLAHLGYLACVTLLRVRQLGSAGALSPDQIRRRLILGVLGLIATGLIALLHLANVFVFGSAWPYLTAMVVGLLGSFLLFASLLWELWD